jgi:CheY-specific phosphatase CheX
MSPAEPAVADSRPLLAARKYALVMRPKDKGLNWLVHILRANGFRVAVGQRFEEILDVIAATPWLSLLVLDTAGLKRSDIARLSEVQEKHPELPILCIAPAGAPTAPIGGIPTVPMTDPNDIMAQAEGMLSRRFYPDFVLDGMRACAAETLREGFKTEAQLLSVSLKLTRSVVGKMVPFISFCGPGVSGHMVLNTPAARLRSMYRRVLARKTTPSLEDLGDLAGEILNQVLGRLKSHCARYGVAFDLGLPVVATGERVIVRVPRAAPAVVFDLGVPGGHIFLEFSLTSIDLGESRSAPASPEIPSGEISFL